MENETASFSRLTATSKRLAQRALAVGSNRIELLVVELHEISVRLLQAALLAVGVGVFGLLSGIALTAAIVFLFWQDSPIIALLILAGLYAVAGGLLYRGFMKLWREWQTLPATLDQLRKDCQCLEENLN